MLIDTHCHLDAAEFDADRAEVVAHAMQLGVGRIVVPAVAADNFAAVRAVCAQYPVCRPALGLHPIFAMRHQPADLAALRAEIQAARPVAIGEIGLDLFIRDVDMTQQLYYFTEQLKIAHEFDLPVLLHTRHANDEIMKQLRRFNIRRGIAHAFSGSLQQAQAFISQGFKLGFGGAMTYTRATNLRKLAAELPLESIVLETDAPDMSPAWAHGRRNSPEYIPQIAQVLADLRGVSLATIMQKTTSNAQRLFSNLPGNNLVISPDSM